MTHPESGPADLTCKECAELRAEIKRLQECVVELDNTLSLIIDFPLKVVLSQYKHSETIEQARKAVENETNISL
jgi:hypothetical protein